MSDFKIIEPDELVRSPLSFQLEDAGMSAIDAEFIARIVIFGGFIYSEDDSTPLFSPIMMESEEFVDRIVSDSPDIQIADSEKNTSLLDSIKKIVSTYKDRREAQRLGIMDYLAETYLERSLGIFTKVYSSNWWKQFINPSDPFEAIVWEKALKEYFEVSSKTISIKFFKSLISTLPREQKAFWLPAIDLTLLQNNSVSIDERKKSPRYFDYWFSIARSINKALKNPKVNKFICDLLNKEPNETIGAVALSLANAMVQSIDKTDQQHIAPQWTTSYQLYENNKDENIINIIFDSLNKNENDELLKQALLRFIVLRFDSVEDLNIELIKTLLPTAKKELGQSRRLLKKGCNEKFIPETLYAPLAFLFRFGSPAMALEMLLTFFSTCEYQMVANDLRYWKEDSRDDPPEPYRWIPDRIATIIHSLKDEQENDPKLKEIRKSLALFFIKRLKTRKNVNQEDIITDDSFVENRWMWRYFYIRALRELKINPKGSGHNALHWVSQNDPHEEVCEEAKKAYKELRHQVSLPSVASPRKALFAAFWWLRQAHLTTLGIDVDSQGTQRTRSKEVTYTHRF